ncbi:MarR family winged helix-turn-helix transcriptional regulator [Deinococcus maricopensis]|uniref:Regulatory protein MarR n=1 Tax=Deinococcus maricopensis (strain DSM 21211 / LMG 22137 / NRRL B-23946 / LB-34) TaxID=709986 RepID=E8U7W0_DEIML|nr:MarR family transcriptional regulator [Deinococcus maricopensis]ADV67149.1 regulatory protein MarR [Deinococcus maricopensis DSM 21211]
MEVPDTPEPHTPDPAQQLGQAMRRLHRIISTNVLSTMQDELHDSDVGFTQMTAMHHLRAHAPLSVTQLAERTRLSVPATSHLVEKMVQRGHAERRENPENRREKLVALTRTGEHLVTRMDDAFIGTYTRVFGAAHPDTLQRATDAITALIHEVVPDAPLCAPQENA